MFYFSDVCLGAKIRILKQITTILHKDAVPYGCLSWRKDKNFKANHNFGIIVAFAGKDVCLGAKIRILKQITTILSWVLRLQMMFVLAQR